MNNHLTLLRFAVTQPDGTEKLHTAWYDVMERTVTERLAISARLKAGAEDVCELVWSPLINNERFSRSRLVLGDRIVAKEPTLESLLEAIAADEQQAAAVPQRTSVVAPLAP